jgi:hypothetical protein
MPAQKPEPAAVTAVATRLEKLSQPIHFVMPNPGETETDRKEAAALLKRLRAERAEAEAVSAALEAVRDRPSRFRAFARV